MPAGNRMGPQGMGPRTGRGAGYCTGNNQPGFVNREFGFGYSRGVGGYRMGGGGGRGYRNMFYATGQPGWMRYGAYPSPYPQANPAAMTPEEKQESLKTQESWLQEQLDEVRSQMEKDQD